MLRKTKNKIVIPLLVLLSFLPFQNCGQSYESLNGEAQVQSSCEGTDCAPVPDVVTPVQCIFNGAVVNEGANVEAFLVSVSTDCARKETRTCQSGVLSGSYGFASCSTLPASKNSCLFNTMTILHDGLVTAFQASRVAFGQTCKQEQRKCNDGVLDGSYTKLSCTVDAPLSCTFNDKNIAHNGSVLAYATSTVAAGGTCVSANRTCSNGVLGGNATYTFSACTVAPPPQPPPPPPPNPPPAVPVSKCEDYPHDRKITIATVAELKGIPARAIAGDLFVIAAGTYVLDSVIFENLKGTATKMITLCGDGVVKIVGPGAKSGKRILTIKNSQYVRVAQLDFSLGMKGLMMEGTNYSRFEKLSIHDVGHEAFHLMLWSHHNVVENSRFYNTGQEPGSEGIGEGVYVGSSLNKGIEDASDYNEILNNQFGPGITAEHIDIKEFTSRGLIEGNQFDGRGITQANSAESWVNIKGNYHTIKNNTGKNTPVRGFKQIVLTPGQGNFNVFENNSGELNNTSPDRMLIYLHRESTDAPNNQVYCNNKVLDQAAQYMTNAKKCIQP